MCNHRWMSFGSDGKGNYRQCIRCGEKRYIKAIKAAGNHVQILTKGDGTRDFDLLEAK
nr:MAG TPA: hypothetical protein [Caudoviricetes sp.]